MVKQQQQEREIYYQLEVNKMKEIDNWLNHSGNPGPMAGAQTLAGRNQNPV